jgi:hypothetical protein
MISMQKEIGSEFWDYASTPKKVRTVPEWLNWGSQNSFFATGRTAIDHIICDIKATHNFESVYMPSYCCYTMIKPFVSNGIEVYFYDVFISESGGFNFNIDYNIKCDAIFVMNYFGFLSSGLDRIIDYFKTRKKVIIIEDATHSLLCRKVFNANSDYVFSSFRKWFAIPSGSIASKISSPFVIDEPFRINKRYLNMRIEGMRLKHDYMNGFDIEKSSFRKLFSDAELLLEDDYKNYAIDDISLGVIENLDIDKLRSERISNSEKLINGLDRNPTVKLLYNEINQDDCPLFTPLIVKDSQRDALKNHLNRNSIYCPVHWPESNLHKFNKTSKLIFDNELSVICDQRYNWEDMDRIISVINNF